jgi:hypothetical protein
MMVWIVRRREYFRDHELPLRTHGFPCVRDARHRVEASAKTCCAVPATNGDPGDDLAKNSGLGVELIWRLLK